MPERVVLVGFGPVGARFAEELLPLVRSGSIALTVVGAEDADAYNRVLVSEYAVGSVDRESLTVSAADDLRADGVEVLTGTTVRALLRSRRTVRLSDDTERPYDRLVLATGARSFVPTLDGVRRIRREGLIPPEDARLLDSQGVPFPDGVTVLRDLADADRVRETVEAGGRIVVLGAGVLGMEFALAAVARGAEACVVHHGAVPMERQLDRGAGTVLASAARRAGVATIAHTRAESLLLAHDEAGRPRFDGLICADGKIIHGDLLVLSCGVAARTELAGIAGLPVARGVLVDAELRSWGDPDIYAIGDCAHVADPADRGAPRGAPSGLIGAGWRQAEWLAARFAAELGGGELGGPEFAAAIAEKPPLVMLKSEGVDLVAAGDVTPEPWDDDPSAHEAGCAGGRTVAQWADPAHGRYVKLVADGGVLTGFVSVGMPRTAAELTLLFERGSEIPSDASVLLRFDGPDGLAEPEGGFAPGATVCWCNGVTGEKILEAAKTCEPTVAGIGAATRAGTGCGGCRGRIAELLEVAVTT
jgi:assimilatory nitrate reductase electron transfer subunit